MDKIAKYQDKIAHVLYGYFAFSIGEPIGLVWSVISTMFFATAKEGYDKINGRKFDWVDWLCTFIGGAIRFGFNTLTT
jgi:hypothetical protein